MDPLTAFPASITAGDTTIVDRSYSDVPLGASWVVVCTIVAPDGSTASVTATEVGASFRFTFATTDTDNLTPGAATLAVTASKAGARYTVETRSLVVIADPTSVAAAQATKLAHITRVIAACEAALEGRMTDDVQMYQLPDGVTVSKLSISEIRETLASYRAQKARILRGGRNRVRQVSYGTF